jgi:hypothetical protein
VIPESAFLADPLFLEVDDTILVRVRGRNAQGWSPYASMSILSMPVQVKSPPQVRVSDLKAVTSTINIQLTW